MAGVKPVLLFLLQSIVVGLAVAFVVVLLKPELLPVTLPGPAADQPASYADAVERSAPAVASIYTRRVVPSDPSTSTSGRFRLNTSLGSAVIIDPEGYLVTNFHVVAGATEIRVQKEQ